MGYGDKRNFAVTVKVIPFRKKNKLNLSYLTPPEQYGNVRSNKPIHPSTAIFTNVPSNETRKHNEKPDKNLPITIILSLSVVVFVIVATVGLLGKWIHRRRTDNNDLKMPQKEDTMGKGKIYVSYLPEKGTINHVNDIYHFLKSNHIDVVMDQMYADQKLYHSLGPKRFGEKFLRQAGKVIMIVTQSYLRICRWDETVNIEAVPRFSSLNEERLFSEVSLIKSELSTTTKHQRIRFIPVLIKVSEDQLPKWLNLTEIVKWPDDRKTDKFVKIVIDEGLVNNASENKKSSFF
ncbi:uncharacterized protein LOC124447407 isoform X2 [Xenia sp. Carnegie-2017]|nr:uncharacterized protein LOC124447407 isoform X2 [Xenia sp. Carnegie-2017]